MTQIEADHIPVVSDLLQVYSFESSKKKAAPLMMEFAVNPETSPFLISSAKTLMWVEAHGKKVRAAFRDLDTPKFFAEVVVEVARRGRTSEWGNVHPLTVEGVVAAIAHVLSYDLPSPEVLLSPSCKLDIPGDMILGCHVHRADWLDESTVVVVPQDRAFVGFVLLNGSSGLSVVHNAGRSIAVCRDFV